MAELIDVRLDRPRCQGHGLCVIHAPEVFDIDDEDFAAVKMSTVPAGSVEYEHALGAARRCPELAITLQPQDEPTS